MEKLQNSKDKNTIDNGKKELYFALKKTDRNEIISTILELPMKYSNVLRPVLVKLQQTEQIELPVKEDIAK